MIVCSMESISLHRMLMLSQATLFEQVVFPGEGVVLRNDEGVYAWSKAHAMRYLTDVRLPSVVDTQVYLSFPKKAVSALKKGDLRTAQVEYGDDGIFRVTIVGYKQGERESYDLVEGTLSGDEFSNSDSIRKFFSVPFGEEVSGQRYTAIPRLAGTTLLLLTKMFPKEYAFSVIPMTILLKEGKKIRLERAPHRVVTHGDDELCEQRIEIIAMLCRIDEVTA